MLRLSPRRYRLSYWARGWMEGRREGRNTQNCKHRFINEVYSYMYMYMAPFIHRMTAAVA